MAKTFKPLSFGLIEEGRLAESLDAEIARAARSLLDHVRRYGEEATTKSKAEVSLKITLSPQSAGDGAYSVRGQITSKLPGRPIHETLAIHETEQETGEETLFVRASGSDADTPRQMKLATQDGRAIDPTSGEALPPREPNRKEF